MSDAKENPWKSDFANDGDDNLSTEMKKRKSKIQMRKILFDDFFSSETHGKTDYMIESLMEKIIREALTGMPKELQLLFALPNDEEQ